MPGFYGATREGQIKLLDRGGGDISGSILAKCLGADLYENWTDVSGFYSADPRIVPEAQPIARVTYEELRELSYMGASVLHEEAVFPVREAGIPLVIKNTNAPQDPGTIISETADEGEAEPIITGVTGKRGFVAINVARDRTKPRVGFMRRALSVFERYDVSVEHMPTGVDRFGAVVPEPLHLDLVIEDDRVIEAIPQIGFVHRGLEKLTEKRDMHQFGYIAERICGICAVGHSYGYASACERMLDIEVPGRVQYIRTILHELSRIHSHLLWLGLLADAFGFEALFYRSWTLREQILKIFESTCGGRVILSINEIGGLKHDIEDSELAGIVQTLDAMRPDYEALVHTFLDDVSCGERLHGVGVISKKDALDLSMVGPFGRASGVDYDVRMFSDGAYADLAAFEPVVATDGDCYARCQVRCAEVTQAMDIIKELVGKIPHDGIGGRTKLTPADGARGEVVIEQPRGEAYYYVRGNGTKNLDRFRVRTPTSQNLAGLTHALQGVLLANVPMIILTIDPCISCTER